MFHGTPGPTLSKTLTRRISAFVGRLDRSLCVDQDWWAHLLGWKVTRIGFGARDYRDPRFDILHLIREVDGGVRT
ncbi:hypothetical protein AB0K60_26930 [Thermopolyspora sp. NPDC052614]|uniref:hypothetical protein n=1 Tax=Thermopolyspora sp. NPDC052614 TaxID=3155682 RepID=UPI00341E9584